MSEQINELVTALAKAQAEMENAPYNQTNPAFKSKYADLASIRDATIPHLAKNGLALFQMTKLNGDGGMHLVTRLAHSSGQWIEGVYPLPIADRPHVMGSALTYARRYSWAAICGIAAEADDDANAANDAAKNGNVERAARAVDNQVRQVQARKSSAAAKRDGDWPKFEQALADCQSAREVERLRSEYQQNVYPAWNADWRDVAEEAFEKRQAEFSQGEGLKEALLDSVSDEEARALLRDQMIEVIQNMDTEADLLVWKESPAFRRDMDALPKPMQIAVRRAGATKLETLQAGQ